MPSVNLHRLIGPSYTVVIERDAVLSWWWNVIDIPGAHGHCFTEARARRKAAEAIMADQKRSPRKFEGWTVDTAQRYVDGHRHKRPRGET